MSPHHHGHGGHHHHHHHHHAEGSPHRFPFEKVRLLDSPERLARQAPGALVDLVATPAPTQILDLGAGSGTFALPLLERCPEARLTALDVEPRMLGVLLGRAMERGLAERVHLLEAPAEPRAPLPEPEAPYDLVLMVNLYHELDDRPWTLEALRGQMASGGRLLICDWAPEGDPEHGPPVEIRVPEARMRAELEAAGFSEIVPAPLYEGFVTLLAHAP